MYKRQDQKLKGIEGATDTATGLLLGSMTFLDGIAYGIKYEMGSTSVELVGMDPATGKQVMSLKEGGFEAPEAYVEPSWSKGCVVVRIQDGDKFELWQVDVNKKQLVQRLQRASRWPLSPFPPPALRLISRASLPPSGWNNCAR